MDYKDLITSENFGVYADIPRTKLTEEEKSSTPYAKFFDLPVPVPSEENIMALLPGKAIDPSAAILPENVSRLFAPGYLECENGYCMLPQGFGFSAVRIDMPDVQPEMMRFWFPWYTSNTVHYKTWLPDMHVEMCHEEQGHSAIENLGWGAKRVVLGRSKPFSPQDFGVANPLESDPDFVMLLGGVNPVYEPGSDYFNEEPQSISTSVNYFRRKGNGMELRIRSWTGVSYRNGQYTLEKPLDPVPLAERVRWRACHHAWEWSRMAALLPEIYQFAKENNLI